MTALDPNTVIGTALSDATEEKCDVCAGTGWLFVGSDDECPGCKGAGVRLIVKVKLDLSALMPKDAPGVHGR